MVLQVQQVALIDRVHTLVRNVADVFDKRKDRSKCPRCRGSGLLDNLKSRFWEQNAAANVDHCWFCEGIGVMPIVGLKGYMLAQASPAFHTRDNRSFSRESGKAHLYLGKYPGTRCSFKTLKLSDDPVELLHDPWRAPEWLSGELMDLSGRPRMSAGETAPQALFSTGKVRKSPKGLTARQPTPSRSRDCSRSDRDIRTLQVGTGLLPRLPRQLGTSRQMLTAQRETSVPRLTSGQGPSPCLQSRDRPALPTSSVIKNNAVSSYPVKASISSRNVLFTSSVIKESSIRPVIRDSISSSSIHSVINGENASGSSSIRSVSKDSITSSSIRSVSKDSITSSSIPSVIKEAIKQNVSSSSSSRSSMRSSGHGPSLVRLGKSSRRSGRRDRNKIREKENKEAVKRAQRTLVPLATPATSEPPCQQPSSSGSASPEALADLTQPSTHWLSLQASKLPWLQPLKGISSSDYSWVNQMVYGSLKGRSRIAAKV